MTSEKIQPELLRASEVARMLSMSTAAIYRMIKEDTLPHVRIGPKIIRIPRRELEEWLHARTVVTAY